MATLPSDPKQCPRAVGAYIEWVGARPRPDQPSTTALSVTQKMALDMLLPVCMERRDLMLPHIPALLHTLVTRGYRPRYAGARAQLVGFLCDTLVLPLVRSQSVLDRIDALTAEASGSYDPLWPVGVLGKMLSLVVDAAPAIGPQLESLAFRQ